MWVEVVFAPVLGKAKSPPALIAGGLLNLLCLGWPSVQAAAVRRHGRPMMMVMTMMAVRLHLKDNVKQARSICQRRGASFIRQCGCNRAKLRYGLERYGSMWVGLRTDGGHRHDCGRDAAF
jgi:hypothetical protein